MTHFCDNCDEPIQDDVIYVNQPRTATDQALGFQRTWQFCGEGCKAEFCQAVRHQAAPNDEI